LKRSALLAAVALLLVQQASAGTWLTSLNAAQKRAKERKQLIFVDLWADWCGWCHKMEQEVFPSEAFQKATKDKVLLRLNTEDGGEGTKIAQQYGISSLPTFLVLTPDLTIAGVINGYIPASSIEGVIGGVENGYREFKKRVANEASISNDYQKRLDLAKEFRAHRALGDSEKRLKKLTNEAGVPTDTRDEAWYQLAITQAMARKYDESLKTLHDFAAVQNKGTAFERSRLLAGDIYVQQGNYAGAITEFKKFKQTFPNSPLIANVDMILPQLERMNGRVQ
jgi:thioredoxin-like negative regulator of GroEL